MRAVLVGVFRCVGAGIVGTSRIGGQNRQTGRHITIADVDTEALGIMTGDIVCFDPRTTVTESGYIKSRFLDDKLSVGILLGFVEYLKETDNKPARKLYHPITVFE